MTLRYPDIKMSTEDRDDLRNELKTLLPIGSKIYTIVRHVSASRKTRHVTVLAFVDDRPHFLSWDVARLLGRRYVESWDYSAIVIDTVGMDGCGKLVARLATCLHGDTQALVKQDL